MYLLVCLPRQVGLTRHGDHASLWITLGHKPLLPPFPSSAEMCSTAFTPCLSAEACCTAQPMDGVLGRLVEYQHMISLRSEDRTSTPASCPRPGVLSLICCVVSLLSLGVRSTVFCYFLEPSPRKELGVLRCLACLYFGKWTHPWLGFPISL